MPLCTICTLQLLKNLGGKILFFETLYPLYQCQMCFWSESVSSYQSWGLSLWYTLGQKPSNYPKIHIFKFLLFTKIHNFKVLFLTKFTFRKSHFSQNSHFQTLIFHKINIFKLSFSTKFIFLDHFFHKIHIFQTSNSW